MKKFALLFSSFAVVTSAVAASPEVNQKLQSANVKAEAVQVSASVTNGAKVLDKSAKTYSPAAQKVAKKAGALTVSYEQPEGLFAEGLSDDFSGYNGASIRKGPAYKPMTWTNTSVGGSEFEWEYTVFDSGSAESKFFTGRDLTKSEVWSEVTAPTLYGYAEDGSEGSYQIDPQTIIYSFGAECTFGNNDDLNFGQSTYMYANTGEGYTRCSVFEYNPSDRTYNDPTNGLMKEWSDPNFLGFTDIEFMGYANTFHAPAAPYFITKMWCWLNVQATKTTTIEMNLYKIDEDGLITDELIASGSANLAASTKADSKMVTFDLFALDEDGLETDEPIVIDSAFIAVMTFNKADLAEVNAVCGAGALYPADGESPYTRNALMVAKVDGEVSYLYSPYSYFADDARTTLMAVTDFMFMVDACYPWAFEVNDAATAQAPVEGGNVTFEVNSLYNLGSMYVTVSDGAEEWLDLSSATIANDPVTYNQILTLPVAALPEGVEGRTATVTFEIPAAPLTLTINQGNAGAVSIVATEGAVQYFDLAGRRVVNPEKGVYVKVSGNKAEKVVL